MSLSGNTMAYNLYPSPPESWGFFFVEKVSQDVWSEPVQFEYDSPCREDNPGIYANGTKLIFESNRKNPLGTECFEIELHGDTMGLWYSEKSDAGKWSEPILLSGAPNVGRKNTQPWVDEENGFIYWTADSECGCIRRAKFDGTTASSDFETIVSPATAALMAGLQKEGVIFVGEYSEANGYAFIACAIATEGDSSEPRFMGRWAVEINLCVIPLNS